MEVAPLGRRIATRNGVQTTELRPAQLAERIMVTGSGCIVVAGAAAFDDTVRSRLVGVFTGQALSELSVAGATLHRVVRTATEALGYGTEGASLLYFAIAAVVILFFMLRT